MYYVKADGTIATNTTIDGVKVGPDGACRDLYGMDRKAQGYDSNTRYLILVNKSKYSVNFYKGSKGHWSIIKRDIPCTIGKKSSPSKSGSFKLSIKSVRAYGYKDFSGSTAFYATRINAGNFFHSVLYKLGCRNPYTHSPKDATLGKSRSNSCIRLPLDIAKYIHQVTPTGTRVIVY
jgi:lipoprotein-anchoring transpeptidase ErfK/SrfK